MSDMLAADRNSWQNPRILALLLLIFLCGALAGALAMRSSVHTKLHQSPAAGYWKDNSAELFSYDKLKTQLNLTSEQSERLKTILDDFVKYHEDLETQIEDVRATGKNRIVQMLTPEQRQKFERLCNKLPAN
jgi:Spy/CpxP family protein refolding chaperone